MERPIHPREVSLHPESANADLISDLVAPTDDRASGISDLAYDLSFESTTWREAWAVGRYAEDSFEGTFVTTPPLSRSEDEELRHLNRLAQTGELAGDETERLIELRLRDRRIQIRPAQQSTEGRDD